MSRFLFVVPPLTGHVNPTVAMAGELVARGHEVAWVAFVESIGHLLPDGATVFDAGADPEARRVLREAEADAEDLRGAKALMFLWERFLLPMAEAMVPVVDAAAEDWQPDVVVADQQAFAGALVARRRGIAWVTSATTSAELTGAPTGLPKVDGWIADRLAELDGAHGLEVPRREVPRREVPGLQVPDRDAAGGVDLRRSPELVIATTVRGLLGDVEVGSQVEFCGVQLGDRHAPSEFEWDRLDPDRTKVLVSMGTVRNTNAGRFLQAATDALALVDWPGGVQGIVVDPLGLVTDPPPDVIVAAYVPQLALLSEVQVVVGHGGHNTACEALAHGVPLVLAPIRDDQPVVAAQVVAAGAGVTVRFRRSKAERIAAAITEVLTDPSFGAAAARVGRELVDAGGAARAAELLIGHASQTTGAERESVS